MKSEQRNYKDALRDHDKAQSMVDAYSDTLDWDNSPELSSDRIEAYAESCNMSAKRAALRLAQDALLAWGNLQVSGHKNYQRDAKYFVFLFEKASSSPHIANKVASMLMMWPSI